jgi:hypothetical protein
MPPIYTKILHPFDMTPYIHYAKRRKKKKRKLSVIKSIRKVIKKEEER